MRHHFLSLKKTPACILLTAALLCGGCSSKYGPRQATVDYYPECYAPIQELRSSESDFGGTVVFGAVLGALLGAAIGAMSSGDSRGALIGAGMGAAAGTIGGHAYARNREQQQEAERFDAYARALDADSAQANSAVLAAREANRCYTERYELAFAQYQENKIGKPGLDARLTEIRDGLSEAEYILGELSNNIAAKHNEYTATLREEASAMGRPAPAVESGRTVERTSADPLADLAYRTEDLNARRNELEAQREEMRRRLQQYDEAQRAVSGA
jgi:outer membrane lipoprotein SlyB